MIGAFDAAEGNASALYSAQDPIHVIPGLFARKVPRSANRAPQDDITGGDGAQRTRDCRQFPFLPARLRFGQH